VNQARSVIVRWPIAKLRWVTERPGRWSGNASFIGGLAVPFGLAVVSVVPEPSAWPMIAVGGVALLGIMLRRKHGIVS
jgi:PEP-CTERM motif